METSKANKTQHIRTIFAASSLVFITFKTA